MVEKFIDHDGVVWFRNYYLPEFRDGYITARMIVSACGYCHFPLQAMIRRLPPEICQAVEDEEKRMFNTLKMPVGRVPLVCDEDLV